MMQGNIPFSTSANPCRKYLILLPPYFHFNLFPVYCPNPIGPTSRKVPNEANRFFSKGNMNAL